MKHRNPKRKSQCNPGKHRKVLVGKEKLTDLILTAIIAEGHILLERRPWFRKTVMAKSLAPFYRRGIQQNSVHTGSSSI